MNKITQYTAGIFLVASTLGACGGGGGDGESQPTPAPAPVSTAEGLYKGTASTARTITGLILNDGTYWVVYSQVNNSTAIAGAVQGTGSSLNGSFSSTNALDFNVEARRIDSATVSTSYVAKQSINGTISYPTLNQTVTFTSTYDATYDVAPSLATIAGTYSGSAAVLAGSESATVVITPAGAITGTGASGCRFTGAATVRPAANVYDISITFNGGVCSNGTSTVTGVGYFDAAAKRIVAVALNTNRTNGLVYAGTKP